MPESLWVRWIHDVYTKGANWLRFNPPTTVSWSLRKICKTRDMISNWVSKYRYNIASVYKEYTLQQTPIV